ncbi:MFS transporter [Halovenus marina]|uniref:MFS transporter n=1 Tax=Halovenus marina TaxID=3396621 RepID=UPI003F54F90C
MAFARSRQEITTVSLVTGGHFLSHFYLLAFPPLFPFLRSDLALSNAQLGLLAGIIPAAMMLQVVVGDLVDRVGAKRVFVGGVAITSLCMFLAGTGSTYFVLLAFAALSGIGQAAFHPSDYPLVETVSDPERRGQNFSIHTFGGTMGFATAPIVLGTLGSRFGWQTALLIVGAVGMGYAVLSAIALPPVYRDQMDASESESSDDRASFRAIFLRPGILVMALFFLLFATAATGLRTFAPLFAIDGFQLSEAIGNTALSLFFGASAVCVLLGGFFADRYNPRYVIGAATGMAALTLLVVVAELVPVTASTFVALFTLAGCGYGLVFASRDRLVSRFSASESTGRSFGFVFTMSSLGQLVTPVFLGAVIDLSTVYVAFTLISGFFLLSGVVVFTIGLKPSSALARFTPR